MRSFEPIGRPVKAGKVSQVFYDTEFEYPLLLWVDDERIGFTDDAAEAIGDVEVGDYLVVPEGDAPAFVMSEHDFWSHYKTAKDQLS